MENTAEDHDPQNLNGADLRNSNGAVSGGAKGKTSPSNGAAGANTENTDELRIKRKTNKGKVEVSEIKKNIDFSKDPTINHIACN